MINVTKSFLPPINEYFDYVQKVWDSGILTNQGPLLRELEDRLKGYLSVKNIQYVSNGTVALNLAINSLDIKDGEIITTPFSFVATTTSILWERCIPVFVDIDKNTLCIDVKKIEEAITDKTKAILAVHVFGYPCDVDAIELIAKKHNVKVIYDAAHAFGSVYKNKSLLDFGDVSTCSFHATKLFHTVEGGACVVRDEDVNKKLDLIKRFGFDKEDYQYVGINAKNSEIHAAMGLSNIKYIDHIIKDRKRVCKLYDKLLGDCIGRPMIPNNFQYNYAYYPAIFNSENELLGVLIALNKQDIFPRRYFYPSLNKLPYLDKKFDCPISEDISKRIVCLPLYVGLEEKDITKICDIIKCSLKITLE